MRPGCTSKRMGAKGSVAGSRMPSAERHIEEGPAGTIAAARTCQAVGGKGFGGQGWRSWGLFVQGRHIVGRGRQWEGRYVWMQTSEVRCTRGV